MAFNKFYVTLDKEKINERMNCVLANLGWLENEIEGIKKDHPFLIIDVEIGFEKEKLIDWIVKDAIKVDKYIDE